MCVCVCVCARARVCVCVCCLLTLGTSALLTPYWDHKVGFRVNLNLIRVAHCSVLLAPLCALELEYCVGG